MSNTDSVLIPNPGTVALPFWPSGQTRLIVIFELPDGQVIVRGLDPDRNVIVFNTELRPDQQTAFLAAVAAGQPATPVDTSVGNQNVDRDTVVITGTGTGDGPGPKYTLNLAATGQSARLATRRRR